MQLHSQIGYRGFTISLLKWILLSCLLSDCFCDMCENIERLQESDVEPYVHKTAVPQGKLEAGIYELDTAANNSADCVFSCCDNVLCNIAFYTQRQCYTIECNPDNPEACEPKKQTDVKFNDTLMVQVRSVEETNTADECSLLSQTGCRENQACAMREDGLVTRCHCLNGYQIEGQFSKNCVPIPTTPSQIITSIPLRSCEFGLVDCDANQECVPKNSRTKDGTCQCVEGYTLDVRGKCVAVGVTVSTGHVTMGSSENGTTRLASVTTTTMLLPTEKPSQKSVTPKVEMLTVSAGQNQEIQLPENHVNLKAFVLPEQTEDNPYHYTWTLEDHPEGAESGSMDGKNTDTLKLSNLIAGLYTFKVQVTATNKFGEAEINVTVKPPARKNTPPVAVINPDHLSVKTTNAAILDGSDSKDDDGIVSYKWEEVRGPLMEQLITGDRSTLTLKDLAPGNYTFKLTVTDSDGATNSTMSYVTVIKETDYPPKANAGSDIIIHLPHNSLVLYGNQSTDDKEIVSYEWTKANSDKQKLAADMQGVRTPELHLSNLEVGDYTFTLKVTDSAGQTSAADVHVFVKPEENTAPVAMTFGTIETSLPLENLLLDASNSTDDQKVTSYLWQQTGGPTTLEIKNADQVVATATGDIKVGRYEFKVTVKDKEELTSSASLTVDIKQVANEPPIARAGGDVTLMLPQVSVTLDGSKSSDDHKITGYEWMRDPKSLAAGDIINSSDHQAVLQLVNLVAGRYIFTLTVTDAEGLSSTDQATVIVKDDPAKKDLLELILAANIADFTEENKQNLEGHLSLLLPKSPEEGATKIYIQTIQEDPSTGHLRIIFYAMNEMRDQKTRRNGLTTLKSLKRKLLSSDFVLDYKVVAIDTFVCQNNCSDHGHCDLKTKLCVCEAFWTQNFFLYSLHGESNCDWSILYVVIICFVIVISITGAMWGLVCCWQRRRCRWRLKSKRRHRYSLLQNMDDENDSIEMKKGKIQNSSVMISESDFSSEEETIFVNQKKSNGHLSKLNGVSKQHLKTKLKT